MLQDKGSEVTNEDIMRMAREAGFAVGMQDANGDILILDASPKHLEAFANLVAAAARAEEREAKWINPNDKTQKQYLPWIGEDVLFCHGGKTHLGHHTGGSFLSDIGEYFNTWECYWMYPPEAIRSRSDESSKEAV